MKTPAMRNLYGIKKGQNYQCVYSGTGREETGKCIDADPSQAVLEFARGYRITLTDRSDVERKGQKITFN